jgi:hypothetical protein
MLLSLVLGSHSDSLWRSLELRSRRLGPREVRWESSSRTDVKPSCTGGSRPRLVSASALESRSCFHRRAHSETGVWRKAPRENPWRFTLVWEVVTASPSRVGRHRRCPAPILDCRAAARLATRSAPVDFRGSGRSSAAYLLRPDRLFRASQASPNSSRLSRRNCAACEGLELEGANG